MRLRNQLALAFALVAALPLLVLAFPARRVVSDAYEEALSARLEGAQRAGALSLDDLVHEADRAAQDLAQGEPLAELAQQIHDGDADPSQLLTLANRLMVSRGIDVLEILDSSGRVLSSGHLPARAGDPDPDGFKLAQLQTPPRVLPIEVRSDSAGIERVLAVVATRPVEFSTTRLYLVAGRQLGSTFAQHLAELTGTEVQIDAPGIKKVRSTLTVGHGQTRQRQLTIPPNAAKEDVVGTLSLKLSAEGLTQAQVGLIRSTLSVALVALALAALLGTWRALRITRPVDALAEGAKALARGELGHRVHVDARGELGELVRTFNAMASDLKNATERAAMAERVAAWQEVARRLAHEIKNPLTPIRMSIETLQQAHAKHHPKFEEIFTESSAAVLEEVDRLKRIVDEFSRFARLPRPQLTKLDLGELMGQVLAIYAGSKTELVRELDPSVPHVLADRDQLTQVLVNLITNAEQAMGGAGVCTVRLRRVPSGEVAIEVADRGPGIPVESRQRIFEPYFTTKEGGSGLGLAIVQRIVSEHGGRIEVGGEPGHGAVFRVLLPAAAAV
jgi:nitrogen fixation/metabolism regulation signal transduction histidine kinase